MNRRKFLIATLATGVSLSSRPSFSFGTNQKKRIIIAGAGLSGLAAAYELTQSGFEVVLLEARQRVGGRVFTLREPFDDSLHVETGGELIGDGYKRFLHYAQKFDITFEEIKTGGETGGGVANVQRGTASAVVMKNKIYPVGSLLDPHPYQLTGTEATLLPPLLLAKHRREMFAEATKSPHKFAEFDKLSLADALRKRNVSETAIRLMDIALNYNSIETVSAGGFLWELQRSLNVGTKAIKLPSGNDQLPRALFRAAEGAGAKFVFEAKINKIAVSDNAVEVSFVDKSGRRQKISADKLICTIPFSVLREIDFEPALPPEKARAIGELPYTQINKTYVQARRENWDKNNFGTSVWTDTRAERIFANGSQTDKRRVFTIWTDGAGAKFTDQMSTKERIRWGKRIFAEVLPPMKNSVESGATVAWDKDEFVRGAYAHFGVGQLTALQPFLKTNVGNIYFAGEHTAERSPGMEGALESAERVVAEIKNSL